MFRRLGAATLSAGLLIVHGAAAEEVPTSAQLAMVKDALGKFVSDATARDMVVNHTGGSGNNRSFVVCGFADYADGPVPFLAEIVETGGKTNAGITALGVNDRFRSMVYDECEKRGAALPEG